MLEDQLRKSPSDELRLIAVEVRRHGFAFVILESRDVLDCGSRTCQRSDAPVCLSLRFRRMLINHCPAVVVMNASGRQRNSSLNDSRNDIARALRRTCNGLRVEVVELSSAAVLAHFAIQNARTKYEIARAVASSLPELSWKLPPQRKAWESEHYRMPVFNAAALGLTYMEQKRRTTLA